MRNMFRDDINVSWSILFGYMIHEIWKERNLVVFGGKSFDAEHVVYVARRCVGEFYSINSVGMSTSQRHEAYIGWTFPQMVGLKGM